MHHAYSTEKRNPIFDEYVKYLKRATTHYSLNTWFYTNGVRVNIRWCFEALEKNKKLILSEQIKEVIEHLEKLEKIKEFENVNISESIKEFKVHLSTNELEKIPPDFDTTTVKEPCIEYQTPKVG